MEHLLLRLSLPVSFFLPFCIYFPLTQTTFSDCHSPLVARGCEAPFHPYPTLAAGVVIVDDCELLVNRCWTVQSSSTPGPSSLWLPLFPLRRLQPRSGAVWGKLVCSYGWAQGRCFQQLVYIPPPLTRSLTHVPAGNKYNHLFLGFPMHATKNIIPAPRQTLHSRLPWQRGRFASFEQASIHFFGLLS